MTDQATPALTTASALQSWGDVCTDQAAHRRDCSTCTNYLAVCPDGQRLAETERAARLLLHRARQAEGSHEAR